MTILAGDNMNTFQHALASGINLFSGAGFSVLAHDKNGKQLPLGSQLLTELRDEFPNVIGSQLKLPQFCAILEKTQKEKFLNFISCRFKVANHDVRYKYLERAKIRTIFTTNVDDLFLRIFEDSDRFYINDLDLRGPTYADRESIDTVWLHGCVQNPDRPMTFSATDIASNFRADLDRWHYLTGQLQKYPTVFLGYSLEDSSTLEALSTTAIAGRQHAEKWILLRTAEEKNDEVAYFRALGFQILRGDIESFLENVGKLPERNPLPSDRKAVPTSSLFPREAIPSVGSVPDRPLLEFYAGAPPVWADIFSGHLHKTEHVKTIKDSVLGGKNTLVIGVPASGKSTALMQAASDLGAIGHRLVINALTREKASNIVGRLAGAPAVIFVDQCCDDPDAFNFLCSANNVTVVGFDREYNFEIISHLVDKSNLTIVPITELSEYDAQAILDKLPREITVGRPAAPEMLGDEAPSLFEVLDKNTRGKRLHERYLQIIQELDNSDEEALDFLLVNCYVHSCRTAVSLDMLLAYFGPEHSYRDIYQIRDRLGAMVSDLNDFVAEDNQDYYLPRSVSVSEAVMMQVSSSPLRRMLARFHERVSPIRISRYDVFKRQAYDNRLAARAFVDVEDGVKFYEDAYERTGNPYVLQHGALYLAKKHRFSDAFRWIDQALTETGGQNFTIRNSHARLLFRANVQRDPNDPVVESTLRNSMDILSQCYRSDRRKAFHALTFADQALEFAQVYGEESGRKYLQDAETWLKEELRISPWHRSVRRLLGAVKRQLQ